MANKRLTPKQEAFADGIADNLPINAAALNAGYAKSTAHTEAYKILENPSIKARIEERKAEAAKIAQVTREQIIGATVLRAFATIDDALDEDGFLDIKKARQTGAIHLIKKISKNHTKFGINTSVEFYSNETAQDKLANYLGLENAPNVKPELQLAVDEYKKLIESGTPNEEALAEVLRAFGELQVQISAEDILQVGRVQ